VGICPVTLFLYLEEIVMEISQAILQEHKQIMQKLEEAELDIDELIEIGEMLDEVGLEFVIRPKAAVKKKKQTNRKTKKKTGNNSSKRSPAIRSKFAAAQKKYWGKIRKIQHDNECDVHQAKKIYLRDYKKAA